MSGRIEGTAVVTGAAGGIGRAICRRLAGAGASIVAVDLSDRLGDVVADLDSAGVPVVGVQADLTTDEGLGAVLGVVEAQSSPLLAIINNAGITRDARLVNMTDENFARVLDVNLGAPHRLIRRLLPHLSSGAIVNISSRAYLGNFGQFNYSMSKGALVGLTRALALDLAPSVRVNAVAPGLIGTEMSLAIPEPVREKMVAAIPLGRMGLPAEVAEVVAFLSCTDSAYITGEVVTVGGGRSLSP